MFCFSDKHEQETDRVVGVKILKSNCCSHEHSEQWLPLHSTAHAHINIVHDICTLTCSFAQLEVWIIEGSDNRGSDDRGWTAMPIEISIIAFLSDVGTIHTCPDPFLSLHRGLGMKLVLL